MPFLFWGQVRGCILERKDNRCSNETYSEMCRHLNIMFSEHMCCYYILNVFKYKLFYSNWETRTDLFGMIMVETYMNYYN
jgi:hypothetical protein